MIPVVVRFGVLAGVLLLLGVACWGLLLLLEVRAARRLRGRHGRR